MDVLKSMMIRDMDKLVHRMVAFREGCRCFMCGKIGTDPHHWVYGRGIMRYRFHLHNIIYLCRACHRGCEADNNAALGARIRAERPDMWAWYENRRPIDSEIETMPLHAVRFIYDSLLRTAEAMGVPPPPSKSEQLEVEMALSQQAKELTVETGGTYVGPQ